MRTVGHYRLRSLIGRGATSEVYTAEHTLLGDVVAIKLLRPELAEDSAQALALVDEGAKVRAIDHPNVVRVLDAGIDPATHGCYLVMEYVAGEPLSARLRRDAPLPEPTVRRLGAELADGIAAAHARNIIHRDLKPANIMLVHDAGDRPKIVDFGIAKHLGAKSAVTTGRMIGTLAYMAPEQLAAGLIAPCTDIWALGVILFEALTARHPFTNFDDGRCAQLVDEPTRAASLVPAISPELDAILARCLARDPARRPASAAELAALLRGERPLDDERITVDAGPVGGGVDARAELDARGVDARAELDARGVDARVAPSPRTRRPGRLAWMTAAATAAASVVIAAVIYLAVRPGSSSETRADSAASAADDRAPTSGTDGAATSRTDGAPTSRTDGAATSRSDGAATSGTDGAPPPGADRAATSRADARLVEAHSVPRGARVVEVRSVPRGARVTIDGKPRGVTPLTLQVALPETIVVERAGYRAARVRVEAAGTVDVTLQRERRAGARATSVRKETLD